MIEAAKWGIIIYQPLFRKAKAATFQLFEVKYCQPNMTNFIALARDGNRSKSIGFCHPKLKSMKNIWTP